jgi:ketosteroid isomerase-like protein
MSAGGDLIRQAYDNFAQGNVPGVLDVLADDVTWDVPTIVPQGGSASGKEEVGQFFQRLGELYEGLNLDIHDLVDGDSRVAGVGVASGNLREGGGSVEYGFVHVFDVEGGKVTRFREYVDRAIG